MDRKSRLVAELKLLESGKKFLDESKKYIPLDRVKQAREEIKDMSFGIGYEPWEVRNEIVKVIDKLIESEE